MTGTFSDEKREKRMLKKNGQKTIGELSAVRRSDRFIILVLLGIIIALITLLYYVITNQKTVIMPSTQSAKYSIGNDQANKEYFVDTTRDIVNLLYNVTPINVDENFSKLLERVAPEHQKDMKLYLDKASAQIKKQQITQVWSTTGLYQYIPHQKAVIANGITKTYLGDKIVSSKSQKIKVEYVMKEGQLFPRNIVEVTENEAK
ncbi:TraE/TraK family type IV conjugative transfer system protein [Acinetobacter baumannii]|uniref:TraE/TraK family type IV conjugative transfer system protein n=1 Tax=Acinetobacter TaxID=469 RepID=UPI00289826C7|nr:TraE/TraK family type IV conjugative transfer system protein [Acinetobacter variabilis]